MANTATDQDPVLGACRRAGQRLGDTAFKEFGTEATEAMLFGLERLLHKQSDEFLTTLGATDDQKLMAKVVIGHALRSRYELLIRATPAIHKLKGRVK